MTAIAQLRAGPFRRGRGNVSEEARQLHEESLRQRNDLRAAILELGPRVAAFAGSYDAGGDASELFVPWGSGAAATTGSALNALLRPFARCKVVRFAVTSETDPSVLNLRIYEYGGSVLYTSGLISAGAGEVAIAEPDLTWPDGLDGMVFSVGPGNAVDEVGVQVLVEEVTE